jgi:hypothetical protein
MGVVRGVKAAMPEGHGHTAERRKAASALPFRLTRVDIPRPDAFGLASYISS